jgi:hypothetical protein
LKLPKNTIETFSKFYMDLDKWNDLKYLDCLEFFNLKTLVLSSTLKMM